MKDLYNLNDWLDIKGHIMLGEILYQSGVLSLKNLGIALDVQKFQDIRLGDVLLGLGAVSKEEIDTALDLQKKLDQLVKKGG